MYNKEYSKNWYQRNKKRLRSKRKLQHKKWVEKNREKVNIIEKRYYNKNKETILKKSRENIKGKIKAVKRNRKVIKENPWIQIYYALRARCNNKNHLSYKNYGGRGIKAFITKEEVKELWFRDKAWLLKQPSIDRKDNDGDYTFDNCRFIELVDNIKKSNKNFK